MENALDVRELEKLNAVSEAFFSLPFDDPKNQYCQKFHMVRWEHGALYRILDWEKSYQKKEENETSLRSYTCEHVVATLIDDVIFPGAQLDNLDTRRVIEYILSLQSTKHWVLHECDFTRYFSYNWSNENLLAALFSIPNRFDQDYRWVFDTSVYPWRVSLKRLDTSIDPELYIRDGKNLLGETRTDKGRDICTRLYALGYGEGVNQLTFSDLNGGKPYIDASAEAIQKYGLVSRIWEDLRFEDPQSLLDRARVLLNGLSQPYESYVVDVADLEKYSGEELDRAAAGKVVRFDDFTTYVTQVERHLDAVGEDVVELANAPEDIAGSIADLADRQRIQAVYAQGATCLYNQSFNDNADATHPAEIQFYVPAEARQINKVILTWKLERFRAYSTGAEYAGAVTRSTSEGGATTQTSTGGGGGTHTSASGGGDSTTSGSSSKSTSDFNDDWGGYGVMSYEQNTRYGGDMEPSEVSKKDHAHYVYISGTQPHSHGISHTHKVTIPSHTHSVTIPSHTHSVTIPNHTHEVSIPAHTHATIYGIYEGPRASSVTVRVDGNTVPIGSASEVDIVSYLSVDGGGKIRRGTFHSIQIIPDSLTRISATLSVQLFVQSEGGGLY